MGQIEAREAEKIVIGSVLLNAANYWEISRLLKPSHFLTPINRRIYEIITGLSDAGTAPTVTMIERRVGDEEADGMVVPVYLQTILAKIIDDPPNPLDYAGEIIDAWQRRQVIYTCEKALSAARNPSSGLIEALNDAEAALADISREDAQAETTYGQAVQDAIREVSEAYRSDKALGFDSGLPSLDEITGRFLPGDLIIIGGSSGSGKTALLMQIMAHISRFGHVLVNQLEMSAVGLAVRGLAGHTGIAAAAMEEGNLNEAEIDQLYAFAPIAAQQDMTIVTRDRTVSRMRARAMAHKKAGRLAALAVDHLRLMEPEPGKRYSNEFNAIADNCSGLKKLAADVGVPVFVLCQRTRGSQKRENDVPQSTDLYGGVVEQDADIIIQTYRKHDRLKANEPDHSRDPDAHYRWVQDMEKWKGRAQVFQTKRRRGEGNRERTFRWNAPATRFEEE